MKKRNKALTPEESRREFFKWYYLNDSGFRKEVNEKMSMIQWLTDEQVQIIKEHSKISGKAEFGVNGLGETFIKLSDGIVKITKNQQVDKSKS